MAHPIHTNTYTYLKFQTQTDLYHSMSFLNSLLRNLSLHNRFRIIFSEKTSLTRSYYDPDAQPVQGKNELSLSLRKHFKLLGYPGIYKTWTFSPNLFYTKLHIYTYSLSHNYCHIPMCISDICSTCSTSETNLTMTANASSCPQLESPLTHHVELKFLRGSQNLSYNLLLNVICHICNSAIIQCSARCPCNRGVWNFLQSYVVSFLESFAKPPCKRHEALLESVDWVVLCDLDGFALLLPLGAWRNLYPFLQDLGGTCLIGVLENLVSSRPQKAPYNIYTLW